MSKKIVYLQIIDSRKNQEPHRIKCINNVKTWAEQGGHEHRIIEIPYTGNRLEMVRNADTMRLKFAQDIPNMCYVDTDVFMARPLHDLPDVMSSDKPIFAEYSDSIGNHPDIFYFYVNGCCDYFKNNLPVESLDEHGYSVKKEILVGLNNYTVIPDETYYHEYSTMSYVIEAKELFEVKKRMAKMEDCLQAYEKGIEQLALIAKMERGLFGGGIRK